MCQFSPELGKPMENAYRMAEKMIEASEANASLIVFGETALQGYGISKDNIANNLYWTSSSEAENFIINTSNRLNLAVVFGLFTRNGDIYNSLRFYDPVSGENHTQYKVLLPDADISDEYRYVRTGPIEGVMPIDFRGHRIAFNICQDSWRREGDVDDPLSQAMSYQPDIFINISASPHYQGKPEEVIQPHMVDLSNRYEDSLFLYVPIVGRVYDGSCLSGVGLSLFQGNIMQRLGLFVEDMGFVEFQHFSL
jgi:NAD+ synthase (glutamine-hydrolysing)